MFSFFRFSKESQVSIQLSEKKKKDARFWFSTHDDDDNENRKPVPATRRLAPVFRLDMGDNNMSLPLLTNSCCVWYTVYFLTDCSELLFRLGASCHFLARDPIKSRDNLYFSLGEFSLRISRDFLFLFFYLCTVHTQKLIRSFGGDNKRVIIKRMETKKVVCNVT